MATAASAVQRRRWSVRTALLVLALCALACVAMLAWSASGVDAVPHRKVPSAQERRKRRGSSSSTGAPVPRGSDGETQALISAAQRELETAIMSARNGAGALVTKASGLLNKRQFDAAAKVYRKLVDALPDDPNVVLDLMTCLEQSGKLDDMIAAGRDAIDRSAAAAAKRAAALKTAAAQQLAASTAALDPVASNLPLLNKLCRAMIYGGAEAKAGRFAAMTQDQRFAFLMFDAVPVCRKAVAVGAQDHTAQYHLGHLLSVLHDFKGAVPHVQQALDLALKGVGMEQFAPDQADIILHDYYFLLCQTLSSVLDRLADAGKCVRRMVRRFARTPRATPNDYYMLGAHISSVQRYSFEGRVALLRSNQLWAQQQAAVAGPPGDQGCTTREYLPWWWQPSKWHTVTPFAFARDKLSVQVPAADQVQGTLGYNRGSVGSWVPSHDFFSVRYTNVSLSNPTDANATQALFYNDCFLSVGSHSLFARLSAQHPLTAKSQATWRQRHVCPVVALVSPNLWNYYHWFAEGMSSLLLAREFVWRDVERYVDEHALVDADGSRCTVKWLLPAKRILKRFAFEALEMLGITDDDVVHWEAYPGKYHEFEHVVVVGWKDATYNFRTAEDPAVYFQNYRDLPLPPSVDPAAVPKDRAASFKAGAAEAVLGTPPPPIAEETDDADKQKARDAERSKHLTKALERSAANGGALVYDLERDRMPQVDGAYDNDLWSLYFPPKEVLQLSRVVFSAAALEEKGIAEGSAESGLHSATTLGAGGIIYCSRGADTHVRKVADERLIVDALRARYGNHSVTVWTGTGLSLADQILTFRRASIVVSPHGAAQTNMLWTRPGTAVVEFHVRNNAGIFSHAALALGLEFWDLSEISAAYFKDFRMSEQRVALVTNVVDHIIKAHGWTLPAAPAPAPAAATAAAAAATEHDEL